ncbi:MAG TPA: DUF1648 domain-containing protein [Caldilineae bacterium]|nr:DUF1648 domain-containing protein [Caldilineae bacterium]
MAFRPLFHRGRMIAGIVAVLLLLASLVLLVGLMRTPLGPASIALSLAFLLALALSVVLLYRLWALHGLDYWVDRDAVRILWASDRIIIPLGDIQQVEFKPKDLASGFRWWAWPAGWVQPLRPESELVSYATCAPAEGLALKTSYATFIISPDDAEGFVAALRERQALGPARQLNPAIETSSYRQHWLLQERLPLILMATGLFFGLILLGSLAWRYPALPPQIPLHFDAAGVPDRIVARRSIFLFSAITLLIGFFNAAIGIALYERHKLASYMLWASALLLQLAGLMIVNRLLLMIS